MLVQSLKIVSESSFILVLVYVDIWDRGFERSLIRKVLFISDGV